MEGRSFCGALNIKIMDMLARATRIQWKADFYAAPDVKIMDRLVRATRIQWCGEILLRSTRCQNHGKLSWAGTKKVDDDKMDRYRKACRCGQCGC